MAFQHHEHSDNDRIRKLFEDEKAATKLFSEQRAGTAPRQWSDGRLSSADDGDLACMVGPHPEKELIVIDFGKSVMSLAMSPQQAIELAQLLIKHARALSSKPLSIQLH